MNPQRWREIEDLYHAALEQEPVARAALLGFLAACGETHRSVANEPDIEMDLVTAAKGQLFDF